MTKKQNLSGNMCENTITAKWDMPGNKVLIQRNESNLQMRHFQAPRGNRFRHYSKIMPYGQSYCNFAV